MASGVLINQSDINKSNSLLNNHIKNTQKATKETKNLNKELASLKKNNNGVSDSLTYLASKFADSPLVSDKQFALKQFSGIAGDVAGKYTSVKAGAKYFDFMSDLSTHEKEKSRVNSLNTISLYKRLEEKQNKTPEDKALMDSLRPRIIDLIDMVEKEVIRDVAVANKALKDAQTPKVFEGAGIGYEDFVVNPSPHEMNKAMANKAKADYDVQQIQAARNSFSPSFLSDETLSNLEAVSNLLNTDNDLIDDGAINNLSDVNILYCQQSEYLEKIYRLKMLERKEAELARQAEEEAAKRNKIQEGRSFRDEILASGLSDSEKIDLDYHNKYKKLDAAWDNDPDAGEFDSSGYALYQQAKTELFKQHVEARNALSQQEMARDRQATMEGLTNMSSAVTGLMSIVESSRGKQSGTYKALFAMSKAFNVAQATLNLQGAIIGALNAPDGVTVPQKFANMAAVAAAGVQLLSSITSITMAGQAHAGIDYIPREGTWLLDRGERVVDSRTNADLKQYLRNNAGSSSGGGSISVNVPLSIQSQDSGNGGVSVEDANILAGLIKSKVYEIVTNEQRPGGLLSRG